MLWCTEASIRLWEGLETQFADVPVVKRGFGGSRMLDCAALLERLVLPYRPRTVALVNTENQVVRRNRLNLLSRIRRLCLEVADLTKIEG